MTKYGLKSKSNNIESVAKLMKLEDEIDPTIFPQLYEQVTGYKDHRLDAHTLILSISKDIKISSDGRKYIVVHVKPKKLDEIYCYLVERNETIFETDKNYPFIKANLGKIIETVGEFLDKIPVTINGNPCYMHPIRFGCDDIIVNGKKLRDAQGESKMDAINRLKDNSKMSWNK
jgi:hypothetical protein